MISRKAGMRNKIMSVVFLTAAVLLSMIFVILNIVMYNSEKQAFVRSAEDKAEYLTDVLNSEFDSALDISNNISQSQIIIDMLKKGPPDSMEDVMDNYDFVQKYFRAFTEYGRSSSRNIRIYPIDENFLPGIHISEIARLRGKDIISELDAMQPYESMWIHTKDDEVSYVAVYRKIISDDELLGYLEIEIPFFWIKGLVDEIQLDKGEQAVYISKDSEVLYQNNDLKGNLRRFDSVLISGDTVSLQVNTFYMMKDYYIFALISAVVFAILMCAVYFLCKTIIYNITKELHDFLNELDKEETALLATDFSSSQSGDKDIEKIKEKFTKLILKIAKMHNDIDKINEDKKKIELEYLQMSFNPHMLYNSLSAISWMLRKSGNDNMVELVEHMTAYYRAVLSGGSNIITVREEFDLIKQYIAVVEASYRRRLKLIVDCDDELLDCFLIKQLLQPIVENAVLHGAKGQSEATISIRAERKEKDIYFYVFNNGYAMTEEEIEKSLCGKTENIGHRSYGILNTINRIQTYYGSEYGLSIRGIEGKGTEVVIKIECLDENTLKYRM